MRLMLRKSLSLALLLSSPALAQPEAGPALFGGLAFHGSEVVATGGEYDSHGGVFGVDFQLPTSDAFSLNPFASWTVENSEDLANEPSVRHRMVGVEGRAWFRQLFLGLHAGYFRQVVEGETYEVSGGGLGWGMSLGVEGSGELFVMGRYVQAGSLEVWENQEVDVTGLRVMAGRRF